MKGNKTYKDFSDALYELKKINGDISYGRIAQKTGILEATINALANRRRANAPDDDVIQKIADCFNVTADYFYEWRLKKFLEFVDKNRDFLDHCEKIRKGYTPNNKKGLSSPTEPDDTEQSA
jgi:transcriptional regulator with XRE-family HTH domain